MVIIEDEGMHLGRGALGYRSTRRYETMFAYPQRKTWTMIICCGVFLLSAGCADFLKPETGAVARKEARIALADERGAQEGVWDTHELLLVYTLSGAGDTFSLSGKLTINRSISDSFPNIARLFFYLSFLDDAGRVVEAVDITPLFTHFGAIPGKLDIRFTHPRPAGSKAIAFSYFGVMRDSSSRDSVGEWAISYFPFD